MRRPLVVHLILQENADEKDSPARKLADEIYSRLSRGDRPTLIPVRLWLGQFGKSTDLTIPDKLPLEAADRNVIVPIIDQHFFDSRKDWKPFFQRLEESQNPKRDRLLPIAIFRDAFRVASVLADVNCIPVDDPEAVFQDEHVFQAIFTGITRVLPEKGEELSASRNTVVAQVEEAPNLFLCHAKNDGDPLAQHMREQIGLLFRCL